MTHAKLPAAARELVSVCVEARDMGQASADLAGQSVRHRTAQASRGVGAFLLGWMIAAR